MFDLFTFLIWRIRKTSSVFIRTKRILRFGVCIGIREKNYLKWATLEEKKNQKTYEVKKC